jgi:anti-sigma factor RsiW
MNGHLGDELSALLDGELVADERRAAEAHLAACATCREELVATASTRAIVRGLPAVDAPFGFYERVIRRSGPVVPGVRRRGLAAVAAGAAAAVALLVLATPSAEPVDPAVDVLVARHAATASAGGDPVTELVPVGVTIPFEP